MASVLVVGPHPDDQELGMGGAIALFASQGHKVCLLDMTNGEPTPHGDPVTRAREASEAAAALSAPGNAVSRRMLGGAGGGGGGGLPNRRVEHTLEARHMVAGVIRAVQAEIVFAPYFEDAHPDHLAVTRIVEDARFDAKLTRISMPGDEGKPPVYPKWFFYYYATHLRVVPRPSFILDTSAHAEQKQRSVLAYRTQFVLNPKNTGVPEWVAAADRYFGSRIGAAAGEPFFSREVVGLKGLDGLV